MSFTLCVSLCCICQSCQLSKSSDHVLTHPPLKRGGGKKKTLRSTALHAIYFVRDFGQTESRERQTLNI